MTLTASCGGGDDNTVGEAEAESESEGQEGEAEFEGEAEGESEAEAEAEAECEQGSCDDGVACTDDTRGGNSCECSHEPDHAYCFLEAGAGTVCDPTLDCIEPTTICTAKEDCPDLLGGCMVGSCDSASNTCFYGPLDTDGDGHAAQACEKLGGDDCDNSNELVYPGAPELCDGRDNDCDSVTDLMTESCGTNVGECSIGTQICTDGDWSSCTDIGPADESCNGLDDDCDEAVDENWSTLGTLCDGTDGDSCPEGTFICNIAGAGVTCTDTTATIVEICNGEDDDCDVALDELWSESCEDEGVLVACVDGSQMECDCCDTLDNDDDTLVDSADPDCAVSYWCPMPGLAGGEGESEGEQGETNHTAIWTGTEMIIWGGTRGGWEESGGGAAFDPTTGGWRILATLDAPDARAEHVAIWTGTDMIIWGGGGYDTDAYFFNSGALYDSDSDVWVEMNLVGAPSSRKSPSAVWTGSEMIVWGGWNESSSLGDGARYDPLRDEWTPVATEGAPSARSGNSVIWTGTEMIVWGGDGLGAGPDYLNTGGRYIPALDLWSATATSGAASARVYQTAVWTGSEMLVWGGYSPSGFAPAGGRYAPLSNTWSGIPATTPIGHQGHSAVWTGSEMIIWGRHPSPSSWNSGGRYDPALNIWSLINAPEWLNTRSSHACVWTGSEMLIWGGSYYGGFGSGEWIYLSNGAIFIP
ncbi:MAG: MopE-related protein [bacterium]|nr:MopE-related protein [bacterium]